MYITSYVIRDNLNDSLLCSDENNHMISYWHSVKTKSKSIHPRKPSLSKYLSLNPNGFFYRLWILLGIILSITLFVDIFIIGNLGIKFSIPYFTHPLTDIYFIVDIIIRFHTEYIDDDSGQWIQDLNLIRTRYLYSWFIFDLMLSIPYSSIRHLWDARPMIKLLSLKEKSSQSVMKLLVSRKYRQSVIQTVKDYIKERKIIKQFLNSQNSSNINPIKSNIRKVGRFLSGGYRMLTNVRLLTTYSSLFKSCIAFAMSLRSLSLLSKSKRRA